MSICSYACHMLMRIFVLFVSVDNWEKHFETKLSALLNTSNDLPDDEVIKLGKKDQEAYPFFLQSPH